MIADFSLAHLPKVEIDRIIAQAPPHMAGIFRMVRDHDLRYVQVLQGHKRRFWPLPSPERWRPVMVHIGDDMAESLGPRAFHTRSLVRLFKETRLVVLNAADVYREPYVLAGVAACVTGRPIVLVECRPSTQDKQLTFAKACGRKDGEMTGVFVKGMRPSVPGNYRSLGELPALPKETVH